MTDKIEQEIVKIKTIYTVIKRISKNIEFKIVFIYIIKYMSKRIKIIS